ncbi:MAG: AMP-binding protein [Deltaproteobacteria bacterium]|nr:AMP-binding protein [Deltaproteobacteria bacterium]
MSNPIHFLRNADAIASAARFARALDQAGVPTRGAVAILMANTPEYIAAYRGATWSGRRLTPCSTRWTADDVAYVVGNCEADAVVVDARYAELAREATRSIDPARRFVVDRRGDGDLPDGSSAAARPALEGFRPWSEVEALSGAPYEKPLCGENMLYTSGTTGRPKGVLRRNTPAGPPPTITAQSGAAMMTAFLPEGARDGIHLVSSPLYHSGPNAYCDGALLLGADLVLMERFEPEAFLEAVERHRATSTFLVPTHFVRLLRLPPEVRRRYDLSSLSLVCHGSAPVSIEVKRAMIDWWGPILYEFYGGTEGGGVQISSQEWLAKPGSVGRPRPGLELAILDDAGEPLPPRAEGRVCFKLDATPFEYKGDPEKTQESRHGDGYFSLGDVGFVDEDGYLFLCDRRSDVIISGGVNLYPAKIESVILGLPFVADCCVVGVPNDEWGEEVRAVVQLQDPAASEAVRGDADERARVALAIRSACREKLSGPEVPRGVDFDDALPRTETGKLARRTIRERYWQGRTRRI